MGVVWYTGNQAGPQIYQYLSEAGKHTLLDHKALGLYLAIAMAVIFVLKVVGCKTKKFALEALAIVALFAVTATTLYQGKMGGQIVYNHGQPFKASMIMESLHEAVTTADEEEEDEAKVEIYEDTIDEINGVSEEVDAIYGNTPTQTDDEEADEE